MPIPRVASGSEFLKAVDCLPWTAGLAATCYGVRVGVRVSDASWLPALQDRLPPGWQPTDSPEVDYLYSMRRGGPVPGTRIRRYHVGFAGPARIARTLDETEALEAFESVVLLDIAAAADPWVFVHAGVVGINGRAVVIPGPSTYGKTRLVEALVRAGATYFSDEDAVIDERGRVHPYARKLSIRDDQGGANRVSAHDLGGGTAAGPLPVGAVVSTRYCAGESWTPRVGTAGEAVLALFSNAVRARIAPAAVLSTLTRAVDGAIMLEGPRGEANETARAIVETLFRRTA